MEKSLNTKNKLGFFTKKISSNLWKAEVKVDSSIINSLYNQTVKVFQRDIILPGFKKESTPISYVEKNYKNAIESNMKNHLFKHLVIDFLMDKLIEEKLTLANYPRLTDAYLKANKEAIFSFEISIATPLQLKEWKYFIFRAPKRKQYKDLDKQVTLFIKRETIQQKKINFDTVEENDWVLFQAELVNNKNQTILSNYSGHFWVKINNKYIKKTFQTLLKNKKIGENFITNKLPIINNFTDSEENKNYSYKITIKKIAKGNSLSLKSFKSTFKLKSKTEVHNKLIEVFSYRNNISQRRSIIEEVFHLLLSKHRFEIPKHFSIRRQEDILSFLKKHPDYNVYKLNKDFYKQISMLAEKQLKEEILIDQLAYKENITIDHEDIKNYLYLFNNKRLREFVYFKPILEKIEDSDFPLQTGLIKQYVLRETTLNYIIHELME